MVSFRITPMDNSAATPIDISERMRSQLVYFITPSDAPHVPPLKADEYWIDTDSATQWLEEGVFEVVSPLDSENKTTIELSEEQELFFEWLVTHQVRHIRLHKTA
ncbi:MAG: hypothetical protein ETSY2_28235 [Candidatus Entotheonella gemina]|uniref:Uncharacterized protein n=1 Tax=Candidatus Entotheonella gemina TaxID=1429439 RepID=W4M2Y7_9BACT|nr:MAG: hypothetical protein ETSY2_28235 [Candidatus Entotheonella gemina]